jgi:hypothetical protein
MGQRHLLCMLTFCNSVRRIECLPECLPILPVWLTRSDTNLLTAEAMTGEKQ